MFFTFLKLYKWYQIAQHITYSQTNIYNIFDPKGLYVGALLHVFICFISCKRYHYRKKTHHMKLIASDRAIAGKVKIKKKKICYVSNNPKVVSSFLTIQAKTWICQCFYRLSQNTILECTVFKLLPFIHNIHKLYYIKM